MKDVKLDFDDILISPQFTDVTSRKHVQLTTKIRGAYGQELVGVPIIAANMHGVGTFAMAKRLSTRGLFTAINKDTPIKDWFAFFDESNRFNYRSLSFLDGVNHYASMSPAESVFFTMGMGQPQLNMEREDIHRLKMLLAAKCFPRMNIVIDVANGYMNSFYDYISRVREVAPDAFIMAGTVCTPEGAERIIRSGADLARVGIGTGAVCTTRKVAGVGYPQASAIAECSQVANVVADGGCVDPGDFAKAFALGASMVMAGSVFAAHDEGGVEPNADGNVVFYGMSSKQAQTDKSEGGYRSSEGRVVSIPHRGSVLPTADHILGGLRSACAYSNAFELGHLHERASVVQVNRQLNRSLEKYTI